jgi:poly(3-hydroxybutyrate) depolymerase
MKCPLLLFPLVSLSAALSLAATELPAVTTPALPAGAGRFEFHQAGKTVPVWFYRSEGLGPDAPILIVMHGVKRDADRYRDEWTPYAQKYGCVLVAPEFSEAEFPGNDNYSSGGTMDKEGHPRPRDQWSYSFIEPIFDLVKKATGNRSQRYLLFGHSAGSQFVHRFLYFEPEARVGKAIAANAGWWTLPDPAIKFPYGLQGSVVDEAALKVMLQRPLIVLLGTADVDPDDKNLRKSPEAMAQGPNRFTRGHTFFNAGKKRAETLKVPFGWRLETAPNVGHSDSGMAAFAAPLLLR